jgi:hypothetical protein
MKQNVGKTERWMRAAAGATLAGLHLTGAVKGKAGKAALAAGSELMLTAATGYCPVNHLIGRSSATPRGMAL